MISIFGRGLGPEELAAFETGASIPNVAGGTEIWIDGIRAPILAAASNQLVVVAPFRVGVNPWMEILRNGRSIHSRNLAFAGIQPDPLLRITAQGEPVSPPGMAGLVLADVLNADGTRNSADQPAQPGSWVTLFASGLGLLDGAAEASGYGDGIARPLQTYRVRTSGTDWTPAETVTVPARTVAVLAVRFRVPDGAEGPVPFVLEPGYAAGPFCPAHFFYAR